jgi:signal transduction histidine kinase
MTGLRRALVALAIAAFALGIGSVFLILTSDHASPRGLQLALVLVPAWGFISTGLYAWDQRPGSNIGPLMTAVGFTWFFQALAASNEQIPFTIGSILSTLPYAVLIQLLLSFPSGRLETRLQRGIVGLSYFVTTVMQVAWGLLTNPEQDGCHGCPENPILIEGHQALSEAINAAQSLLAILAIVATVVLVIRRWRRSAPRERRALSPLILTGAVAFLILLAQLAINQAGVSDTAENVAFTSAIAAFALMPFAFLIGLLRSRLGRGEEIRTALTAENAQLTAELEAKVAELRASRTRIVEAGYAERRRVERDLHDGAQQHLVALTMSLRLVRSKMESDPGAAAELLDEAMAELDEATTELRELARGIHPAVLSDRGLEAALSSLADRSPVPVEIVETPSDRLPGPVESATYFVIAEALTNVARYAGAEAATVRVARENGAIEVEVRDDGVGGADPADGTGLRGLEDRVAALEGRLQVTSPRGEGTTVVARIPCA